MKFKFKNNLIPFALVGALLTIAPVVHAGSYIVTQLTRLRLRPTSRDLAAFLIHCGSSPIG